MLIALAVCAVAVSGAVPVDQNHDLNTNPFVSTGALVHAERLATDLLAGPPAEAFLLVAEEAGHGRAATPTVPSVADALAIAGVDPNDLPAELVVPVGRLLGAIQVAETLRADAVAELTPEELDLVQGGDMFAYEAHLPAYGPGASAGLVTYTPRFSDAERAAIAAKVDMDKIVAGTVLILETIRDVMPLMPTIESHQDGPGGAGCTDGAPSIYDNPGNLAIDDGNTRWTADYTLIIDLGGNDCHENTAATGSGDIEVVLELVGNDLYRETSTSGAVSGIGYGATGIGILVDATGQDAYVLGSTRTAPQPGPTAGTASVVGQGSAALGAGVVVDGDGIATFTATARSSGASAVVSAQGTATFGGVGLVVSGTGAADTTYLSDATSTLHLVSQTPSQSTYAIGPGTVTAQGAGNGGAGGLADAGGDDTYTASSFGSEGIIIAQGAGSGGVGVLADGAGNDGYVASAEGDVVLSLIVTDTNFCWTVTVNTTTGTTSTLAQGAALTGAGVLADLSDGGSNEFTATARSGATSHAEVRLSASPFCTNSAHATAATGTARVTAQGLVQTGAGILLGGTGADTYTLDTGSTGTARALVRHGLVGGNTATAQSGSAESRGHGHAQGGAGIIADLGGDDAYRQSGATSATRTTTTGGTVPGVAGTVSLIGEGWATGGIGWLLDLGGTDTYATPSAGNDRCWTQPTSGTTNQDHGRGRDLSAPYLPLPSGCP